MPRRKKYPKLPSGWGSVRYLGKGRRNCYAVHPPATECYEHNGHYIQPKALCYVSDWYVGFAVLNSYRAGTYKPGDEIELSKQRALVTDDNKLDSFVNRILSDASLNIPKEDNGPTFTEVYERFFDRKYGENATKKLSASSKSSTQSTFKNLSPLHGMYFKDIRLADMQRILDECPLKEASVELMRSLLHQVYAYAIAYELCDRDYSAHLVMPQKEGDEHGIPFSIEELKKIHNLCDDPTAEMTLIMCYSGFRISAYKKLEVNLEDGYFKGGIKTKSSKGRVVPIHAGIYDLVEKRLARDKTLMIKSEQAFRADMKEFCITNGITEHTPHDCRHTFSALCEKYGISEADRKRMLGHSFGNDITNGIYGHRELDDLKAEIAKIPVPSDL